MPLEPRIWAVGRPRDLAKWQSPRPWELGAFPLPTVPPAISGRLGHGTSCAAPGPDTAASRRGSIPPRLGWYTATPLLSPASAGHRGGDAAQFSAVAFNSHPLHQTNTLTSKVTNKLASKLTIELTSKLTSKLTVELTKKLAIELTIELTF